MLKGMLECATDQADARAAREKRDMIVYHVKGPDVYGRTAVFYVRPVDGSEGGPPWGADVAYKTALFPRACPHARVHLGEVYEYCEDCGATRRRSTPPEPWHSCPKCKLPGAQ